MQITNASDINKELKILEIEMANLANKITDSTERTNALNKAATILKNSMVQKVPVGNRVVKRYINGKVVATYHPGNLKRSIQILDLKDKKNAYVGVKRLSKGKSKGVFRGSNVDGYYAHMVEYGRHKRPFIRPAVDAVGAKVLQELERYVIKTLNARN